MSNKMKILRISDIQGLYNELYRPQPSHIENTKVEIINNNLNLGMIFWSNILSDNGLKDILKIARFNLESPYMTPQLISAINNEEIFLENVRRAKLFICDQGLTEKEFFSYLEVLSIVCDLYNVFKYKEIKLTINEGFIADNTSSKQLYYNCSNPIKNPVFTWIYKKVMPQILEYRPNVIFFDGRPSLCFFAIAKMIKQLGIPCHMCISRHSSEYYSLSKIQQYLVKNEFFFKVFDSVILDSFEDAEYNLIHALSNNISLNKVNNLIFIDKFQIICNNSNNNSDNVYKLRVISRDKTAKDEKFKISPSVIADVHLIPYHKCYWNKCSFCGINKKYLFQDIDNKSAFYDNLKILKTNIINKNIEYIWFIDEALPPDMLREIAQYFIDENIKIVWQARCRIEKELIDNDLPQLLYRSGLRELRLGLESGSIKVLKLMNKFPDDFNLEIVTKIASEYDKAGISIHFPIIIGFPGETLEDRRLTYEYLTSLREKYKSLTFNINILSLDVSSNLFIDWDKFNIKQIELPCNPEEFVGNIAIYNDSQYYKLDKERNSFMRSHLYPWLPEHSSIKPNILYRLSETIRDTMIWKSKKEVERNTNYISTKDNYRLNENLSFSILNEGCLIYNWDTHHYIIVNDAFREFLLLFKESQNIINVKNTSQYKKINSMISDYIATMKKLINNGFLLREHVLDIQNNNLNNDATADYYNEMYASGLYDYDIVENEWLKNNLKYVPQGTILDIGIGCGQNIDYILRCGYSICGIDISQVAIDNLKNRYSNCNCEFYCDDISKINIGINKYSLIICSMSLHYLNEDSLIYVIDKIKKSLIEGGYIYISVLSTNDALYKNSNNTLIKHFFTKKEMLTHFNDMKVIEVTESMSYDEHRNLKEPFWGTLKFVFRKEMTVNE